MANEKQTNERQMRIKARTLRLLRMFAGEIQMQIGKNITDDDAIYNLIKQFRPDLIERLKEVEEKEGDSSE
jgi:hypothetical protein